MYRRTDFCKTATNNVRKYSTLMEDYGGGREYLVCSARGILLNFLIMDNGARIEVFRRRADRSWPRTSVMCDHEWMGLHYLYFTSNSGFDKIFEKYWQWNPGIYTSKANANGDQIWEET